jgi:hypothetical protein
MQMFNSQAYFLSAHIAQMHSLNRPAIRFVVIAISAFCVLYLIELVLTLRVYDGIRKAAANCTNKHLEASHMNNFEVL